MHLPAPPSASLPRPFERDRYSLRLASSQADVIAAQSLRYHVFALEMGAVTPGPPGLDADGFDDLCDHLVLWQSAPGRPAEAVGTYRLLPPHSNDHHPRSRGLYADGQFGLMPMESILDRTVEVGRACVRAERQRLFSTRKPCGIASRPSSTRSAMTSATFGAMPKPILKPPLATKWPARPGHSPSIGARLRARGRTPAQRSITGASRSAGQSARAFAISASIWPSVVSGASKSRSAVEPTATVPS